MTRTVSRDDGSFIAYLVQHAHDTDTLLLILQGSDCNSVLNIDSILTEYKNVWPEADVLLIEKYGINRKLKYSTDPALLRTALLNTLKRTILRSESRISTLVLDIVRKTGNTKSSSNWAAVKVPLSPTW